MANEKITHFDMENFVTYHEEEGIYDFINLRTLKSLDQEKTFITSRSLDSIAFEHYGTEHLWWFIAYYNDIVDPFVIDEVVIRLPNKDQLILALNTLKNSLDK